MFDVLVHSGMYWTIVCRRHNMNSCREFINRYYPEEDVEITIIDRSTGHIFNLPITEKKREKFNPVNWKIDGF
jgi:hypothetical protein